MSTRDIRPRAHPEWAAARSSPAIVVIACSAGGYLGLVRILSGLDADFPAAIALVQHRGIGYPERLPSLLQRHTALKVRNAVDGDLFERGTVYVCPPGMHMTAEHSVRLIDAPKLRFVKPSADLMLQSVAHSYGDRAIAVVLSGSGSDATAGCGTIQAAGGKVLAQIPASCPLPWMPSSVIAAGHADLVLTADEIAVLLGELAGVHAETTEDLASDTIDGDVSGSAFDEPGAAPATTSVVLADDHRMTLDGLRTLLSAEAGFRVLAEAHDGVEALELVERFSPDVVVLDIGMPRLDGVVTARRIRERDPEAAIIMLSARVDERTAAKVLKAGAMGYVSKGEAFAELSSAIRSVVARRPYFSPRVAPLVARAARAASRS
jgi:two-component system chemotaxis response regulator CheB